MRAFLAFFKMTAVGGALFLLPFGIVLVVLGKLYTFAKPIGSAIHDAVFPWAPYGLGPFLFAVLVLVGLAFVAGVFARSRAGQRMFGWLEATILSQLPPYAILRQMVADMTGSADLMASDAGTKVVLVRFDDAASFGFLIERRPAGEVVVFLPDAPFALSGSVVVVEDEQVEETNMAPKDFIRGMRRLGAGLELIERS